MTAARYPIDDPRDEGRLADLTSAGMWTTAGLVGSATFLLPRPPGTRALVTASAAPLVTAAGLLECADQRLLYRKRLNKAR